jgi:hypothetical protein
MAALAFLIAALAATGAGGLPLTVVADVPLPGDTSRFDYESYDPVRHLLFIAHLGQSEVLVFVSDETGGTETVIDIQSNQRIAMIRLGGEVGNTQYDPVSRQKSAPGPTSWPTMPPWDGRCCGSCAPRRKLILPAGFGG